MVIGSRSSTGVKGLDSLLGGGMPTHSVITVVGAPGAGKTTFCRQTVFNRLKEGGTCVYVATSEPVDHITEQMKAMGWDTAPYADNLIFIDAYSWRMGEQSQGKRKNVYALASASELNEANRLLTNITKEAKGPLYFVIDSISDLVLYSAVDSVFKFLQLFVGLVKSGDHSGLVIMEEGLHEPRVYTTLNYVTDGTIEMKVDGAMRLMRIARMMDTQHPLKWVAFTIGGRGVEVEVEKFFG
jgi:KaiC/GvpD/RAD55 family RecA-like ATPase